MSCEDRRALVGEGHLEDSPEEICRKESIDMSEGVKDTPTVRGTGTSCVGPCLGLYGRLKLLTIALLSGTILILVFLLATINRSPGCGNHSDSPITAPNPLGGAGRGVCARVKDDSRFDCLPEAEATEEGCRVRGCCWEDRDGVYEPRRSVPKCYYPPRYPGYRMGPVSTTSAGMGVELIRQSNSHYPSDVKHLQVDLKYETDTRLHIKIYDANKRRYEIPRDLVETPEVISSSKDQQYSIKLYNNPFSMQILRKDDGQILMDTSVGAFIYSDQLIQLSTLLPSVYLYGLGEYEGPLLHNLTQWDVLTMWAIDKPVKPNANLYGSYPFYISMESSGKSHGVYLHNSNAMDVLLQPTPALTWRTTGGILDLYVFLGPTPGDVVKQYTDVIGRPILPPYWSLGFHLCRWGYNSANRTREILHRMRSHDIPMDVQWNDIDYMADFKDFTFDPDAFDTLMELVDDIHSMGQKYVMMTDPPISSTEPAGSYAPYERGLELDVFVKQSDGADFVGIGWPGPAVFPDFTNPTSQQYWSEMMVNFHNKVPFDGMWLDMSEPTSIDWAVSDPNSIKKCPLDNSLESPPYVPNIVDLTLSNKTICTSSQQYAGSHYNVHNLYGHSELMRTYYALTEAIPNKRPFIIARSTFSGSNKFSGHWLGDNRSEWPFLKRSIAAILNFNLFGYPLVGPDICGFDGNVTEELCQRWHQVGAFYPFSRNHNANNTYDQDPTQFSVAMLESSRSALQTRYKLLPYLYTLFHRAHLHGDAVIKPLFVEFPSDVMTYTIDEQFLWGEGLLISPALHEGQTSVDTYFPDAQWYDYYDGSLVSTVASMKTLPSPLDTVNLHVRGGYILPYQHPALTTTLSRLNKFGLIVPLDGSKQAAGSLYWDDGEAIDSVVSGAYLQTQFECSGGHVTGHVTHDGLEGVHTPLLGTVEVYGVETTPHTVTVNNHTTLYNYNSFTKVLTVENLSVALSEDFNISWS